MFGILCLTYNLWEFFTAKYSTKQGVTFVIECLLGIGLIFLPDLVNKFLKIIMPPTIVYFYWFFLFISVFLGTSLHMISIISFWDKILHFVSPMLLTAVGICDSLGNMNLQRYNMSNGQPFIGRAALMDTMGDLFTNTLGAFVMGVYTYIRSKGNPEYLENYAIKRK